ncbi:LysR substrate-binding domain-containing protein [Marinicella sp. S1101]|uniref:LysR substrate-binding domain-containing protein n=1 Tax=Marinicella marina TaxID=2996016 RepID=UPI00226090ED|nr:LysR substrate-binding domain-containing protein [Marinicella marina]MCX7555168.1 LysR substrate-binding domain-containing protein [Marinicella marina]MDJ1139994.1 LysR substrate-binding domain-containing protein [Marinicella marina]
MKLQQLRFFEAVCRENLNVTAAAKALFTSQPGVSRQVRMFEDELGVSLFKRQGKSLVALTAAGEEVLLRVKRALKEIENISAVSKELGQVKQGRLNIATTHTQARYVLPAVIKSFHQKFPEVKVNLHQGTSKQNIQSIRDGEADFTIASGNISDDKQLVKIDCFKWQRYVVVPKDHHLADKENITLAELSKEPLIVYVYNDQENSSLVKAFRAAGLDFQIVFTARDSDVIKTYVRSGLGVGIIASMAIEAGIDDDLVALETKDILPLCSTWIAFQPSLYLRQYMQEFITLFAPHVSSNQVQDAIDQENAVVDPQKQSLPVDSVWHI